MVDSASDYTVEEIKQKQMELVPICITIGEKSYMDGFDLGRDEFYELLTGGTDFPKTAQPSPQSFLDAFHDTKEKGDSLIYISLSSALSGTYQSAVLAKNIVDYDQIYVVDSLTATYTIKLLADYACQLREQGEEVREIVQKLEELKPRVKVLAALDTLEFLARGGRISKAVAAIGNMAKVKPIITISEQGEVEVIGKCLGKNKATTAVLNQLQQLRPDPAFPLYSIYSYGEENCINMEEKLLKEGITTDARLQIGSTIGTHIGPRAFGLIFVAG
jgi:DegV family protein with EDD domain